MTIDPNKKYKVRVILFVASGGSYELEVSNPIISGKDYKVTTEKLLDIMFSCGDTQSGKYYTTVDGKHLALSRGCLRNSYAEVTFEDQDPSF